MQIYFQRNLLVSSTKAKYAYWRLSYEYGNHLAAAVRPQTLYSLDTARTSTSIEMITEYCAFAPSPSLSDQ